jgi:hypothetical protein
MISGGLDSVLAVAVLKAQGIEITGLHFLNGFSAETMKKRVCEHLSMERIALNKKSGLEEALGIEVRVIDVSKEFLGVLASPKHGYGRNVNPCIDCRIFLLGKAKEIMDKEDYDFIFTGEVLGQRPMSQHAAAMKLIERRSALEGRLLRPLCAKLLPLTKVERDGIVDREKLLDIQGRSRKRQMALADEYGLTGYAQPAGGCTLTDENYARRYLDLSEHSGGGVLDCEETVLLSVGRHLRLSADVKIVVGRNQTESEYIESGWGSGILLTTVDHPGPTTLVQGDPDEELLRAAAAVTARYSDGKLEDTVRVYVTSGEDTSIIEVEPAGNDDLSGWRI